MEHATVAPPWAQAAEHAIAAGQWHGARCAPLDAALPAALFGLGGVLHRYKPEGDSTAIAICCLCSLVVHPVTTYGLGLLFQLPAAPMRSAVITASMAPGVNAYLFASIYNSAKRVAASTVLVSTALSILTIWFWISVLP